MKIAAFSECLAQWLRKNSTATLVQLCLCHWFAYTHAYDVSNEVYVQ